MSRPGDVIWAAGQVWQLPRGSKFWHGYGPAGDLLKSREALRGYPDYTELVISGKPTFATGRDTESAAGLYQSSGTHPAAESRCCGGGCTQ